MEKDVTFACASPMEMRAAQKHGRTTLVGIGCALGNPRGHKVSWGFAGALRDGLDIATIVVANCVKNILGETIWKGEPLIVPGAIPGIILGSDRLIDDPEERRYLHRLFGADIVDMESHRYTEEGSLVGCIRVVSDSPTQPLGLLASAMNSDGSIAYWSALRAFALAPRGSYRTSRRALKARRTLRQLSIG